MYFSTHTREWEGLPPDKHSLAHTSAKNAQTLLKQSLKIRRILRQMRPDAALLLVESISMVVIYLMLFSLSGDNCNFVRNWTFRVSFVITGIMCGSKIFKIATFRDLRELLRQHRDRL